MKKVSHPHEIQNTFVRTFIDYETKVRSRLVVASALHCERISD